MYICSDRQPPVLVNKGSVMDQMIIVNSLLTPLSTVMAQLQIFERMPSLLTEALFLTDSRDLRDC